MFISQRRMEAVSRGKEGREEEEKGKGVFN